MENLKVGQSVDVVKMICDVDSISCKGNWGIYLSDHDESYEFSYYNIHVNTRGYSPNIYEKGRRVLLSSKREFKRVGKLTIKKVKSPKERKEFKLKYG